MLSKQDSATNNSKLLSKQDSATSNNKLLHKQGSAISNSKLLSKQGSAGSTASTASLNRVGLELESPGLQKGLSGGSAGFGQRLPSFRCSKFSMDKAAQGGHLDVLKMLHEQVR